MRERFWKTAQTLNMMSWGYSYDGLRNDGLEGARMAVADATIHPQPTPRTYASLDIPIRL